jgi:hypothetical protein
MIVKCRNVGIALGEDTARDRLGLKRTAPTGRGKPPVGAKPLVKVR